MEVSGSAHAPAALVDKFRIRIVVEQ